MKFRCGGTAWQVPHGKVGGQFATIRSKESPDSKRAVDHHEIAIGRNRISGAHLTEGGDGAVALFLGQEASEFIQHQPFAGDNFENYIQPFSGQQRGGSVGLNRRRRSRGLGGGVR